MPTTTDPTQAGQAPMAGGHSGAESTPFVAAPTDDSALKQAYLEIQAREQNLPKLAQDAVAARNALNDDKYYFISTDDTGVKTRTLNTTTIQAYTQAAKHADDLEKAYQDEVNNLTTQWTNISKILADNQNNAAQRGMDTAKLAADRQQADRMAGFYRAQAASYQADADQKNAEAAYNAALREAYTPQEAADHQKRVDEAKIALDTSNARLNDANATAQEAANGVAPALAQAGLTIQQAKAANASRVEGAAADTAVAGASSAGSKATIDAATAANAPAATAATTSSLQSQAAIDAANAAVAGQAANAAIQEAVSRGDLNKAQAAEVMALLEGKKQYAQAQIEGQQAANAQTRLTTHQLQVGDVQTKIEQLSAAVKGDPANGVPGMDPAQADRIMEDYLSGSTPFQRQQQRETQLSGAMNQALSYGMGVLPGQQYLPGAEPGGAYDRAFSKLGVDLPNVQLTDARPLTSYVQAQGIQTQEQPAPRMFSAAGGYTPPAATAPTAVPAAPPPTTPLGSPQAATAAGQPTSVSQPTHAAVPVVTTAQLLGQQPAQAAAGGGTFGVPYVVSPYGGAGGSALGGWSGVYPPESEALPLSPLGTVPYPTVPPLAPEVRNAAGGTTVVPRAMQGMLHQPKVARIPIFAARKAERRPMFAGRA